MDMHRSVSVVALTICILSLAGPELCCAQNSPGDFLAAHNRARAAVGVGPMTWNSNVAAYARSYAEQRRGDCALVHSSGPYGENIAWGSGDLSGVRAVEMWVAEKSEYNYGSNTCTGKDPMGCLHYTQVVWRDSTQLGCARVRCSTGGTFIICSYNPRGNYIGQRPYEELAMSI